MTLVVFGAGGQVGRELAELAQAQGLAVRVLARSEVDITDAAAVAETVRGADFVVNCAAYTAVDKAEAERDQAFAVNATAPGVIAQACAEAGAALVHISTDYVFPGDGDRPWREDDPIAPLSVYGESKAAGEAAVRSALPRHIILRTSWVFAAHGSNFVRTMLRLGAERPELRIVADQRGGPTAAADIAAAILAVRDRALAPGFSDWGTFHFSGAPATTWYEFAAAIFAARGGSGPKLHPIATSDYPTPARRPANSVMDCGRIARVFGVAQPDWRQSLAAMLRTQ
ncbi:dTDP-4-dehydrorhamnose reductase [Inquilinus ginsengisoli]|uniref:dTDP-4-dehydrorhamnose reductase n=1 Tax=Inquilinus ginsengisoli TaxID=363840 RepID=A0ABU1JKV4_9PROT|nr:dTDP-4-dehydrorhamnose reductase [Inquilinus ginsengisoli]MDR6289240.1 dTDP-4-dehydrorhamnose reductase [Inquilinus ginsengisoli]